MVNRGGYNITDEDARWLEQLRAPKVVVTKCCPRCQRGPIPGQFPCGRPGSCPNLECAHAS